MRVGLVWLSVALVGYWNIGDSFVMTWTFCFYFRLMAFKTVIHMCLNFEYDYSPLESPLYMIHSCNGLNPCNEGYILILKHVCFPCLVRPKQHFDVFIYLKHTFVFRKRKTQCNYVSKERHKFILIPRYLSKCIIYG